MRFHWTFGILNSVFLSPCNENMETMPRLRHIVIQQHLVLPWTYFILHFLAPYDLLYIAFPYNHLALNLVSKVEDVERAVRSQVSLFRQACCINSRSLLITSHSSSIHSLDSTPNLMYYSLIHYSERSSCGWI